MKCETIGCPCTTCGVCGRNLAHCICDLRSRTQSFIATPFGPFGADDHWHEAINLLKEWCEV